MYKKNMHKKSQKSNAMQYPYWDNIHVGSPHTLCGIEWDQVILKGVKPLEIGY